MATPLIYTRSIIYATMPPPTVQKCLFQKTGIEADNKLALKKVKVLEPASRPIQALLAPTARCVGTQTKAATRSVAVQIEEVLSSNKAINTKITSLSGFSFSSHYYFFFSSSSHATPIKGHQPKQPRLLSRPTAHLPRREVPTALLAQFSEAKSLAELQLQDRVVALMCTAAKWLNCV
ncbi:hypothetical protein BDF19DRAFT_439425 [Syncephalis fuscata]|nr:hypothetical protein BDF19DRAFT_439425 [Syncephalis fuscata]